MKFYLLEMSEESLVQKSNLISTGIFYRLFISLCFITILVAILFFLQPVVAYCEDSVSDKKIDDTISITSDALIANKNKLYAEFSGNVEVIYIDGSVLTANNVKILFHDGKEQKTQTIKKFIASGNVQYTYEDKKAFTNKAVYTTKDQILVMTGKNSKITSDGNSLTGDKIVMYRKTGAMKVTGSKNKRVSATFKPASQ